MTDYEQLPLSSDVHVGISRSSDDPESSDKQSKREHKPSSKATKKIGNRVLMIGRVRELALYRAEVLKISGFEVAAPADLEESLRIMQRTDFDALVLSYTLPSETVQFLAERARECCPDCPIIAITHSTIEDRRVEPDAIAFADQGPASLLQALRSVLAFEN